jgi:hypothetical protein
VSKADDYRRALKDLQDWEPYLLQNSGLPGPRGNLELAQVVADSGSRELFDRLLSQTPDVAPVNSPQEFLAFCGAVGLGRLLAEGELVLLERIRPYASDPRWRMREGVAMALQRWGKANMDLLLQAMAGWSTGNWLEKRAAAAALAEPALLREKRHVLEALQILDEITGSMQHPVDARDADFKTLQQGMGYCWSVVVAAAPVEGKQLMEKWLQGGDPIILRVMQENLKKNRLVRMDADWVEKWRTKR